MSETERSGKSKRAQRWTAAKGREVVERWRGSGQSAAAFALQHGISASRLSYWSKQFEQQESNGTPQFVAVAVRAERSSVHAVEIGLGDLMLRVHEGADPGFIAQLVSALQCGRTQRC
jgi:transposase-like protein